MSLPPNESMISWARAGSGRSSARYLWAMLLARICEVLPLLCRYCGTEMRIIAFVIETASVSCILEHVGEPLRPPRLSPACGPPGAEGVFDKSPDFDPLAPAPESAFQFDQTMTW